MNWDIIEGKWEQFKGNARIQWGKLTDDELDVIAGNKSKLAGKIQEKYGYSRDKAEAVAEEWKQSLENNH
jgi:uncharacterized protein YjbJ (UPF0337 family)